MGAALLPGWVILVHPLSVCLRQPALPEGKPFLCGCAAQRKPGAEGLHGMRYLAVWPVLLKLPTQKRGPAMQAPAGLWNGSGGLQHRGGLACGGLAGQGSLGGLLLLGFPVGLGCLGAELTPTVILAVEAVLAAQLQAAAVAVPLFELAGQVAHPVLGGHFFPDGVDAQRVLVGAQRQGGAEPLVPVLGGVLSRALQAHPVAQSAPFAPLRVVLVARRNGIEHRRVVLYLGYVYRVRAAAHLDELYQLIAPAAVFGRRPGVGVVI